MGWDHLDSQKEMQIAQIFYMEPGTKVSNDIGDEDWIVACNDQIININQ